MYFWCKKRGKSTHLLELIECYSVERALYLNCLQNQINKAILTDILHYIIVARGTEPGPLPFTLKHPVANLDARGIRPRTHTPRRTCPHTCPRPCAFTRTH